MRAPANDDRELGLFGPPTLATLPRTAPLELIPYPTIEELDAAARAVEHPMWRPAREGWLPRFTRAVRDSDARIEVACAGAGVLMLAYVAPRVAWALAERLL